MTLHTAPMSRRSLLIGALSIPAVAALLAACGQSESESPATEPGVDGPPPIVHPTGPDEVIVRIGFEGGFVAPGTDFAAVPSQLIAGNGQAYSPGVVTLEFPGALVAPIQVQSITETGIQKVLQLATAQGLLAPAPEYERNDQIADAPDTVVVIAAGGQVYTHRAYALGIGDETDPKRKALAEFVTKMSDLTAVAGASEVGLAKVLEPVSYRIQARPLVEGELTGIDPAPTIVEWPSSTGVDLATAGTCAKVTAEQAGTTFSDANSNTFFTQGGITYRVSVAVSLPGDAAC